MKNKNNLLDRIQMAILKEDYELAAQLRDSAISGNTPPPVSEAESKASTFTIDLTPSPEQWEKINTMMEQIKKQQEKEIQILPGIVFPLYSNPKLVELCKIYTALKNEVEIPDGFHNLSDFESETIGGLESLLWDMKPEEATTYSRNLETLFRNNIIAVCTSLLSVDFSNADDSTELHIINVQFNELITGFLLDDNKELEQRIPDEPTYNVIPSKTKAA